MSNQQDDIYNENQAEELILHLQDYKENHGLKPTAEIIAHAFNDELDRLNFYLGVEEHYKHSNQKK